MTFERAESRFMVSIFIAAESIQILPNGGNNLDEIRQSMEKHGIPGRDLYELPTSKKRFLDGCQYRIEISGVERPSTLEALIDEMEKRRIPVHRLISMVMGATLLS